MISVVFGDPGVNDVRQFWNRADVATARVPVGGHALYRGWMLRSEQYTAFADALARRDITLCTSPAQYERAHELPGWYQTMESLSHRDRCGPQGTVGRPFTPPASSWARARPCCATTPSR